MVKVFTKQALQQLLKSLRSGGYIVTRINGGYRVYIDEGDTTPVLTAMVGANTYIARYDSDLFTEVQA